MTVELLPTDISDVTAALLKLQAAINAGGGDSSLTLTDGVNTVGDVAQVLVSGGVVGGVSPDATLTVIAGGSATDDITTGASPLNLPAPSVSTNYFITTGGTKGIEIINLAAYGSYADAQVGRTALFLVRTLTSGLDQPTLNYNGGSQAIALGINYSLSGFQAFILVCDGQNWFPQGWWQEQALPSGFQSYAEFQATASGIGAHAECASTASGLNSHAEGDSTASGISSHAEGNLTLASAPYSHSEGISTVASGNSAHAEGQGGTASAPNAHVEGEYCVADEIDCQATGSFSWTRGIFVAQAYSSGAYADAAPNVVGDNQVIRMGLRQQTTDATPSLLTADQSPTPSANNQLVLVDNETAFVEVVVVGKTAGATDILAQRIEVIIQRGTGAASTAIPTTTPTTPVVLSTYATAGAISGSWAIALSADTTNGALAVTVTGQSATTINWTAELRSREVVF